MLKSEIVDLLNGDLQNEYTHMNFYLQSSILVQGLHREEFKEFLSEHAASEMQHIQQFGKLILGLDGIPVAIGKLFPNLSDPTEILKFALQMEEIVVENYLQRIADAQSLGGVDGKYIEIFLEEQMVDSRGDIDELKMLLK